MNRAVRIAGGRFVRFEYCISLIIVTIRRESAMVAVPAGSSGFWQALPYNLITAMLGWWGVPWGLFFAPVVLWNNCAGGREVASGES